MIKKGQTVYTARPVTMRFHAAHMLAFLSPEMDFLRFTLAGIAGLGRCARVNLSRLRRRDLHFTESGLGCRRSRICGLGRACGRLLLRRNDPPAHKHFSAVKDFRVLRNNRERFFCHNGLADGNARLGILGWFPQWWHKAGAAAAEGAFAIAGWLAAKAMGCCGLSASGPLLLSASGPLFLSLNWPPCGLLFLSRLRKSSSRPRFGLLLFWSGLRWEFWGGAITSRMFLRAFSWSRSAFLSLRFMSRREVSMRSTGCGSGRTNGFGL